jgi:hypothetical protein
MYANWDKYHMYFNTYDVEKQYVKYYGELSKKLKVYMLVASYLYQVNQVLKFCNAFKALTTD